MIHITGKFKCKDTTGEEHIVLHVVCWDQANNVNIRKDMIELKGFDMKDGKYYPTSYVTAGEMGIELDLETRIDI